MSAGTNPQFSLSREGAQNFFNTLVGLGYDVALKHLEKRYYIEVPVRLKGSSSYGREQEITEMAVRAGYITVQTGLTLRVVGK